MFEIKYKNDTITVYIKEETKDVELINAITNLIKAASKEECSNLVPGNSLKSRYQNNIALNESTVAIDSDTTGDNKLVVRDRLPNSDNTNLADLNIEKASVTACYSFMCPNCHQSMAIVVDCHLIIKDINSGKLFMLSKNYKPLDNFELLDALVNNPRKLEELVIEEDVAVLSNEEIYGTCPHCGEEKSTKEWEMTFKYKTQITGMDEICICCGSEMLYCINGDTTTFSCENEKCKYSKTLSE